jgi:carbamoyltransferase
MPSLARNRLRAQERFAFVGAEDARALGAVETSIPVRRVEHHMAHLASSFLVSPFDEAAVFSIDGFGDFASAMWGVGHGGSIKPLGSVAFPHSLGIFYTALTQYLGFPKYGDEYKVMGLASYGEPEMVEEFRRIVIAPNSGRMDFILAREYFTHHGSGPAMTWDAGEPTIGRLYSRFLVERLGAERDPSEQVNDRHIAIAASMQRRLEEVVIDRLRSLQRKTGLKKLCLAGGVAYNCVVNGKILEQTGFDEIYIQSAAGDAGLAIGAAMSRWHSSAAHPRDCVMNHAYWGPEFSPTQIADILNLRQAEIASQSCSIRRIDDEDELCRVTAAEIAQSKVVGWFQGRMEWGPRALGNRSILADPRRAEMREVLNSKIKRRETFRPFAPSILEEAAGDYFEQSYPSPFMLMAYRAHPAKRSVIPATTHVDGTGRLQTVNESQNPLYYKLIREFGAQTGVPVLLNTSFNENEPVVCIPEQALDCFLRTKMDLLVMGPFAIRREGTAC